MRSCPDTGRKVLNEEKPCLSLAMTIDDAHHHPVLLRDTVEVVARAMSVCVMVFHKVEVVAEGVVVGATAILMLLMLSMMMWIVMLTRH